MSIELTQRNATLQDMVATLTLQQEAKHDAVVPAAAIKSVGGTLVVDGMGPDGPVGEAGMFQPTRIMDGDLADKLGIPVAYLRRLREQRIDLFDANVNGWMRGSVSPTAVTDIEPDGRNFLLRTFLDPDGGVGIGRALLSDSYRALDNLDMVTAVFAGIREAGVDVEVQSCDVTETRMAVKITAPEVQALAPQLLKGYRSPFTGNEGSDNPVMFAGLVFANSETGGGAYTVVPRIVAQVCTNGMCIKRDAMREVHLGSKQEEGVVKWSTATHERTLELVASKTRDAVTTFLDVDYMTMVIDRLEEKASVKITDPAKAVELVGTTLRYTEEQRAGILDHFIKGGQVTAGGIMQAVTSFAQVVEDADVAWDLEMSALTALDLAAQAA